MMVELGMFVIEFARDIAGDDLRLLFKKDTSGMSDEELLQLGSQAFMGLYATNGNNPKNKHGVIPAQENYFLVVYANVWKGNNVRLFSIIVSKKILNKLLGILSDNEEIQDIIIAIRVLMVNPNFDKIAVRILFDSLIKELEVKFSENDEGVKEIDRITEFFGD